MIKNLDSLAPRQKDHTLEKSTKKWQSCALNYRDRVMVMMFNATFNNISVISWWSVLLVEEPGVSRENHRPVASH